jgi:hypothetical protein
METEMNITAKIIVKLADFATKVSDRRKDEHIRFLSQYEKIVRSVSPEAAKLFGCLDVKVIKNGKEEIWGINLTATDYIFWVEHINLGVRFCSHPNAVMAAVMDKMANSAEIHNLTKEERNELIDLLSERDSS